MKRKKNKLSWGLSGLLLAFMAMGFVLPQQKWEVMTVDEMTKEFKLIEDFYKNTKAYSVKVTHQTFKNHETTIMEDQTKGFFIKDSKNNYHSYAAGIRTLQNAKVKLTIDSTGKSIIVNDPDKTFTKEVKTEDMKDMLKVCSSIKKSGADELRYRFEFGKNSEYQACEIRTTKEHRISRMIIYFNTLLPSDPDNEKSEKTKPRAEVIFSDYKTGITPDYKKYFDETKYVKADANGNYKPAGKYADFSVYDSRVKK